jgi:putative endonuclease
MSHHLYILWSIEHKKTYVGITDTLERRLKEHNSGASTYTSNFLPWVVIFSKECKDRAEARVLEKYYKSASGRKKLAKLIPS